MSGYIEIIRELSEDKFQEIFAASARKSRETYFARHWIKTPKQGGRMRKPGQKNALRAAALFEALQQIDDDPLAEEILRVWLLGMRPLLAKALDHLEIEHDNGLTDSDDVNKIAELGADEIKNLVATLEGIESPENIALYLKFMGAKDVDASLAS